MKWSQHSNVQVSIFVTCLNFAVTGSGLWQLYVALVMTWYLAFKTAARTAKLCSQLHMYIGETQCRMPSKFSDAELITYRQHTSFYRTLYVPDMNYIIFTDVFSSTFINRSNGFINPNTFAGLVGLPLNLLMHMSKGILNLPTSSLHLCSPFHQNR